MKPRGERAPAPGNALWRPVRCGSVCRMSRSLLVGVACASLLTTSARAFFFGWISQSGIEYTPNGPVATLDLYALFSDDDELLLSVRDTSVTFSNVTFLHDDFLGGTWRPQFAGGFGEFDSFVLLGGFAGPGNSTGFSSFPSPDQAAFPAGMEWFDASELPFQGVPLPLPFINLFGVQVGRFVIDGAPNDPCNPVSPSFVFNATVVYEPFIGALPVEATLSHLAVFALPIVPGDLNLDGVVNGEDLGLLLGAWGPCEACQADINGDEVVDGGDLGIVLAAWTQCD